MMELPCALHTITVPAIFISHLVILQLRWRLSYSAPKPTVARRPGVTVTVTVVVGVTVGAMAGRFQAKGTRSTWTRAHPKRRLRAVPEMAFRAATKFVKMFLPTN